MINVGVKEIKNSLSRYLARVKEGEDVIITERGKPVARIIMENREKKSIRTALLPLIESGTVILPSSGLNKKRLAPKEIPGKPVSEMVIEDRR
jgi:antitoxin (DNA-binding transcriptional repressor) of toxin-antitoxin stability system